MANVRCPLKEAVAISGRETAIVEGDSVVLFSQLDVLVSATTLRLMDAGVQPGDRVALRLEHRMRTVVILLACIRAGAVACPLSRRLPAAGFLRALEVLRPQFLVDDFPWAGNAPPEGFHRLESGEVISQMVADLSVELAESIPLDQTATLIATSGSTGAPRFAALSYGNHYYSARGANQGLKLRSHDVWMMNLPLEHVGGLAVIFRCLLAGATMVFPTQGESPVATWERESVSHISMVPTQLRRALTEPDTTAILRKMKAVILGGGPLPPALIEQGRAAGVPVHPSYGLTESSSMVCLGCPKDPPEYRHGSGSPLAYREIEVGREGEIRIRGAVCFQGYWNEGRIESACDADGWFATGDVGRLDDLGVLDVLGRKDLRFESGGEKIYPEEVEAALLERRGVEAALVVAVPDEEFGMRPVAFVRGSRGGEERALQDELREVLPACKVPVKLWAWPEGMGEPGGLKPSRPVFLSLALERLA